MISVMGAFKFLAIAIILSYFTPYSIISYFIDPKSPMTYLNIAKFLFNKMDNQESKEDINWKNAKSIYEFTALDINGKSVNLSKYKDHVCLIVNVACKCGLTDTNYKQLQELYSKYHGQGFDVLAFPSNQFMQEPGNEQEIKEFTQKYNIKFEIFGKIHVNGDDAHPLYKYLKLKEGGTFVDAIKWNFSKFLVDKSGQPVKRYGPNVEPKDIEQDIVDLLKVK